MSIWERLRARYHRCRSCEVDGIEGSLLDQFPGLKPAEVLKFGRLYRCSKCGRPWFLHEHRRWLERIPDASLPLVRRWNQSRLTLEASVLDVLASICGVADDCKGYIAIPCSAQSTSGHRQEKALVLVSKQPPLRWPDPERVHWADELVAAVPSPFALPLSVRRASTEKREEAMGFSPVGVVDGNGTEYTLASESHFFDYKGIRGEQLRLSGRQKDWRNIVWPQPAQAFYFIDWYEECEELLVPHRRV